MVLLPDPEVPMMATYSPWWKSTDTPLRAWTVMVCSLPPGRGLAHDVLPADVLDA